MSLPEAPAETEAKQILANQVAMNERLDQHAAAINAMGANVEWIVDNVKGIFQMFGNPAFMTQMGSMIGAMPHGGRPEDRPDPDAGPTG